MQFDRCLLKLQLTQRKSPQNRPMHRIHLLNKKRHPEVALFICDKDKVKISNRGFASG